MGKAHREFVSHLNLLLNVNQSPGGYAGEGHVKQVNYLPGGQNLRTLL